MIEDIKKFEEERNKLLQQIQNLDGQKNQILLRLAEIQGILKYLNEKVENKDEK